MVQWVILFPLLSSFHFSAMYRYERSIRIDAPIERVFAFHDDTRNLLRISPPGIRFEILEISGPPGLGKRVRLRMVQFGVLRATVAVEFVEHEPPHRLADRQTAGPFRSWLQTRIMQESGTGTLLTDLVEYEMPFGPLGRPAHALFVRGRVEAMFRYRQERTRELIEAEER